MYMCRGRQINYSYSYSYLLLFLVYYRRIEQNNSEVHLLVHLDFLTAAVAADLNENNCYTSHIYMYVP